MKKHEVVGFDIDAATGETVTLSKEIGGVKYKLVITPEKNADTLRKNLRYDENRDPTISLGPRGGAYPLCGK